MALGVALYAILLTDVLDVVENLKGKAGRRFSDRPMVETDARHNLSMFKQSLGDHMAADPKNRAAEQASKASPEPAQATAAAPRLPLGRT